MLSALVECSVLLALHILSMILFVPRSKGCDVMSAQFEHGPLFHSSTTGLTHCTHKHDPHISSMIFSPIKKEMCEQLINKRIV